MILHARRFSRTLLRVGCALSVLTTAMCLGSLVCRVELDFRGHCSFILNNGGFFFSYGSFTKWSDLAVVPQPSVRFHGLEHDWYVTWRPYKSSLRFSMDHIFFVPLWMPIIPPALATIVLWRRVRRSVPDGLCERCDYDLTGNVSGRCPECGTVVPQTAATAESSHKM